jgi:hypothetical protein
MGTRARKHIYSSLFLALAPDLTRLAVGRLMWPSGIQASSKPLPGVGEATPVDSEPDRAASTSETRLGFLTDLVRLA